MFEIINEEKLSTKERKQLNSTEFGLPKDRKFPLTDETHVRKAIQFFKFCPPTKKNELANNINKRAKELSMEIKIDESSPFYKYANKEIVKESILSESLVMKLDLYDMDHIDDNLKNSLLYLLNRPCYSKDDLLSLEKYIHDNKIMSTLITKYDNINKETKCPITILNSIMNHRYKEYLDYLSYDYSAEEKLFYYILNDLFYSLIYKASKNDSITEEIEFINTIIDNTYCNQYYIYRNLIECKYLYLNNKNNNLKLIWDSINKLVNNGLFYKECSDELLDDYFNLILKCSNNIKTNNIEEYLLENKNQIENELYIIEMTVNNIMNITSAEDNEKFKILYDPRKSLQECLSYVAEKIFYDNNDIKNI